MTHTVLITGAGTGLGLETALHLATQKLIVYAAILSEDQREHVEQRAKQRGVTLRIVRLDVTAHDSICAVVNHVVSECGGIDSLVNNAGVSLRGYFEDVDDDENRRTFDVNLFGTMAVTRAVLPHMRQARAGRLVFISSIGGRIGSMARTAYCASKFGLEGFAESLMQEVMPLGITVSVVEPAIIRTERWTTNRGVARRAGDPQGPYYAWFREEERLADALVRTSPTTPADVAQAVYHALTSPRPRLRYVVGKRAALVIAARRYLPDALFERIYFGTAMRRVTRGGPVKMPSERQSSAMDPHGRTDVMRRRVQRMPPLLRTLQVLGVGSTIKANRIRRFTQHTMRGFYTTRIIMALFKVGLLDELQRRRSVDIAAFAAERNLDATMLHALCDYLYGLKILQRRGGAYTLDRGNPAAVAALNGPFYSVFAYQDIFHNLEALLQKDKVYGRDVTRDSEYVAKGSGAAGQLFAFPMVADVVQRAGFKHVLDLGCGDATFLIDLCRRIPDLQAFGLDIAPEAIADGRRYVSAAGLSGRVELVVGDIFAIDKVAGQVQGIDAAISVYVLHEFHAAGDAPLIDLFRGFRASFPGVPLVMCEVIRHTPEELRRKPGGVMEIQLWHDLSNQTLLTRAEWRSIFTRAGFTDIREEYLDFARTAIFVVT